MNNVHSNHYDDGYNEMQWNCENRGCFNLKCRPKIELFSDCFPNKISFGDIDGIVEISSNSLMIEWKSNKYSFKTAQDIMYKRLTKNEKFTVFLIVGNAETMEISHMGMYVSGKFLGLKPANFDYVHRYIERWAKWAKNNRLKFV